MVAHAPGGSGGVRPALLALVALLGAGCGQKGLPLPPFVHIPAAVKAITAHRSGDVVYLTLAVPSANIDGSHPADVSRIEIYGYTGRQAPSRAQFLNVATAVATIPVAPPEAVDGARSQTSGSQGAPRPESAAAEAGVPVTAVERLTPEALVQGPLPAAPPERRGRTPVAAPASPPSGRRAVADMPLRRFYMAIPFSPRGRAGPPSPVSEFPLSDVPAPPANLVAGYTESVLTVSWDPSGGLVGFLLDQPRSVEPAPTGDDDPEPERAAPDAAPPVPGPTRYNVYRDEPPAATSPVAATPRADAARPVPINPVPLEAPAFTGPVEFGQERCYVVRAIRVTGSATTESDASPPLCLIAEDRFPPAPPSRLTAVPARGIISLLWEGSDASDLAGYLVLRGVPGDATLRPITPAPVTDTRFIDTSVVAGRRYVYAVAAVDAAGNVSDASNRVEETRAEN